MAERAGAARHVIALFGPTASGKSEVAEHLARRIPAEIVSADAMQMYRGLPILTNQPSFPTRLVAVWSLDTEGSVGLYAPLAHEAIDEIRAGGRTPIVVGGTGLYLRAALADLDVPPAPPAGTRERLERYYDTVGAERAHARLAELDPDAARRVHPNDRRRVVRALELAELGRSLARDADRLWEGHWRHPTIVFGLDVSRETLERRIVERTRAMFERGVEEEVRQALEQPLSSTARAVIGLREVAALPREEAIEAIVVRTRRYAAYQRKWMRRIPGIVMLNGERLPADIATDMLSIAHEREPS